MITSKKNLWLLPEHVCIAKGSAVALNLMFETKQDHQVFLQLWDKYLGKMTEVLNYHLTPTDWTILFKTKSSQEIVFAYQEQRKKSKKAKRKFSLKAPEKMISEHIRIFLSQYVRRMNMRNRRKGTLVLERFQKYIVKSHGDYKRIFALLTNQVRETIQKNPRYQAHETLYDIPNEICKNGLLRVGNAVYSGICKFDERVLRCMRLGGMNDSVLRNFFNPSKSPPHPPNSA